ncbi:HAMP domain-containing sensor histidine kinase [Streptomyces sp. NPDC020875]|uniref:sensor histidine kinase n=1 Tax=Streptomyces sp. NPDC020875 TaxID=3154898 RepID=UPI0033CA44E0
MRLFNPRALRWKIAALTALACCSVAAVIAFLVRDDNRDRLIRVGRERVTAELETSAEQYERSGSRRPAVDLRTPDETPAPLLRDLAEQRRAGGSIGIWYEVDKPNRHWMWAATTVDDGKILIVRTDMYLEERSLQLQDRSIVTAVLVALAVVVPLAALATEPIIRRLSHGARTARAIADGDLDARIGSPGRARDEVTEMSAAVDEMAAALQRRLENERRFTADVAHELRTPLMGLVTTAGLLPDDDEVALLLRDRVRALNALVEDLLEISRLDAGIERADLDTVPLGEFVTDVVRRLEAGPGVVVTVPAGDAVPVETDPRRVERIVVNLVANARRHGAEPVEVTVTGNRITVRDHGPGFPAVLLAEGPQRFRTGTSDRGSGHGLGLTVAQGQAGVLGARLTFANAPDGGAVATLDL